MTALSLFTGIGGLDLSAEQAGYSIVGMVEWDKECQHLLESEWLTVPKWGDIRGFNAKEFRKRTGLERPDIIIGGPPCQPFSSAGHGKGAGDERDMWPEFVRVVSDLRPQWFFAENVEGLVNKRHVSYYTKILWRASLVGYNVGWAVVGSKASCNSPQDRVRIFTIGYRNDTKLGDPRHTRNSWWQCITNQGSGFLKTGAEICNLIAPRRAPVGTFPPSPGLGGVGVIARIQRLYARSPEQAWRAYQQELASTLEWREIVRERPELAPEVEMA